MILYRKSNIQNRHLYITFDDGPNPYSTPEILNVLDEFRIKATFFLVGRNIKRFPKITKEIHNRGHIIGNHSYDHPMSFSLFSCEAQKAQVRRMEDLLSDFGIRHCSYFRPPNAICTKAMLTTLADYTLVGVNHWIADNLIFSSKMIVSGIQNSIHNRGGGIIVLHAGAHSLLRSTRRIVSETLKILIPELLSKGYAFYNLDEIETPDVIIY